MRPSADVLVIQRSCSFYELRVWNSLPSARRYNGISLGTNSLPDERMMDSYPGFFVADAALCPGQLSTHTAAAESYPKPRRVYLVQPNPHSTPDVDQ